MQQDEIPEAIVHRSYLNPVVAKVLDGYNLVINKGSIDGIKEGNRFLIYELTEDIKDPITGDSLGPLELSKGTGKAVYVSDRIAVIRSDRTRGIVPAAMLATEEELDAQPEKFLLPFRNPKERDFAKPIY